MRYCSKCGSVWKQAHQFCPDDGNPLSALSRRNDPLVGLELGGRYKLKSFLGAGGTGFVYVADHKDLRREVAVKMLYADRARDPANVKRLRREARALAALDHPHVVKVLDYGGSEEGMPYLVMEKAIGRPLDLILVERGPLPLLDVAQLGIQVAQALSAAHERGIVHRDLKPANVQVDRVRGTMRARILDFGFAFLASGSKVEGSESYSQRLTRQGVIFGTPEYMAPEQIKGQPARAHTDLYALGVMLFELITGKPPFSAPMASSVFSMHLDSKVPAIRFSDEIPEGIAKRVLVILQMLLAKNPSERPFSASFVADELTSLEKELREQGASDTWFGEVVSAEAGHDTISETLAVDTASGTASGVEAPQTASGPPVEISELTRSNLWRGLSTQPEASRVLRLLLSKQHRLRRVQWVLGAASVFVLVFVGTEWAISSYKRTTSIPEGEVGKDLRMIQARATGRFEGDTAVPIEQKPATVNMAGGESQARYEKARHAVDRDLAIRGLRISDVKVHPKVKTLWDAHEFEANSGRFERAASLLWEFKELTESIPNTTFVDMRVRKVVAQSEQGTLEYAAIRALARTDTGTTSKSTRKVMRRLDDIERVSKK